MKKLLVIGLVAICALILAACGGGERVDASAYERIHRALMGMESFAAQASVTYISNNNQHTYETIMAARASGEYRIEVVGPAQVAGNTTVFDGTTITQFNPNVAGRILTTTTEAPERVEILVTQFMRNFINSNDVAISAATVDESLTTVLEASIPGDHPHMATSRLWVNNETLRPVQLIVFDGGGNERIVVVFSQFEYNVNLADEIFQITEELPENEGF